MKKVFKAILKRSLSFVLICWNAFQRWMLKMDRCLYKSLYPMKHPIAPPPMKRIIAVKLRRLDTLPYRELMNHRWRSMYNLQVSTMLRVREGPSEAPSISMLAVRSLLLLSVHHSWIHLRLLLLKITQWSMHPYSNLLYPYSNNTYNNNQSTAGMGSIHERFIAKLLSNALKYWLNIRRATEEL